MRFHGPACCRRPARCPVRVGASAQHVVPSLSSHARSTAPFTCSRDFHGVHKRQHTARGRLVAAKALFDSLNAGLERAWDIVRRDGKLTADNVKAPVREIRRALLEADVSLPVVRGFVKRVEEKALGVKVVPGVTPDQQLVKVVYDELLELLGSERSELAPRASRTSPRVVLLAGLQGVGKTTVCGKLGAYLANSGERVLMASTDVYRPAAIDQLEMLAGKVGVDFVRLDPGRAPPDMAQEALTKARSDGYDTLLVDSAGRLQANEEMMAELRDIKGAIAPTDTLLVVDAMTGQEAAALTKSFDAAVDLTGAVLTKMDGDSRGGAALSVKAVSGKPIKFVGTGEKMSDLEPFFPDRLAGRVLGMGDVLTLVEKAQDAIKEKDAQSMMKKMLTSKFDFNDFLAQYKAVNRMGDLSNVMKMLPGMNKVDDKQLQEVEKKFAVYESLIQSMTREERAKPDLLAKNASRRRRIAKGAGRSERQVNELLTAFTQMRVQLKSMSKMMAASGGMADLGLDDDELMSTIADNTSGRVVPPGLVRRRRVHGSQAVAPVVSAVQT